MNSDDDPNNSDPLVLQELKQAAQTIANEIISSNDFLHNTINITATVNKDNFSECLFNAFFHYYNECDANVSDIIRKALTPINGMNDMSMFCTQKYVSQYLSAELISEVFYILKKLIIQLQYYFILLLSSQYFTLVNHRS